MNTFSEDDILSIFGKTLNSKDYYILSLSGNQQGQFWYHINNCRKAPDIIAVKNNVLIIGEAKIKSAELFQQDSRGISDYNSLLYILESEEAQQKISTSVRDKLKKVLKPFDGQFIIQTMLLAGAAFNPKIIKEIDERIIIASVDTGTNIATFFNDKNNVFT